MLTADKLSWLDSLTISLGRKQLAYWTQLRTAHTHSQSTNTELAYLWLVSVSVISWNEKKWICENRARAYPKAKCVPSVYAFSYELCIPWLAYPWLWFADQERTDAAHQKRSDWEPFWNDKQGNGKIQSNAILDMCRTSSKQLLLLVRPKLRSSFKLIFRTSITTKHQNCFVSFSLLSGLPIRWIHVAANPNSIEHEIPKIKRFSSQSVRWILLVNIESV